MTSNFAGLGTIDLNYLDGRHEIFVGGRNGVGKSQLLLAIALASRPATSGIELRKYIGFSGPSMSIEVHFSMNEVEAIALKTLVHELERSAIFEGRELHSRLKVTSLKYPDWQVTDAFGNVLPQQLMSDLVARTQLPFTDVTYLPADRMVERSPELNLSLSILSREKTQDVGQQTLAQQVANWTHVYNFDVFSSLAALHYAGLLQTREDGKQSSHSKDFSEIADSFQRATGKRIQEPALQPDGGIALEVEVPGGGLHRVNTLSAGELVALQILQFVKTHFETGSILLIDEPEQHLHPSLQVEIANAVRNEVGEGQLWMVTHSPNILNDLDGADVLVLSRDSTTGSANATFADTEEERLRMFDEIGLSPGLWVPGNFIAVVEGPTDERVLRRLLPKQFAPAFFVVAGSSSSVVSIADKATKEASVPLIAIRDRDRRPIEEVIKWNAEPGQFMWSGYALESLFLDVDWILDTFKYAGWTISREELDEHLRWVFEDQREDAKKLWMREEMVRRVPSDDNHRIPLPEQFKHEARKAGERAEYLTDENIRALADKFESSWESNPLVYVEPKRALAQLASRLSDVAGKDPLMRSMVAALHSGNASGPEDLNVLSNKLSDLLSRGVTVPLHDGVGS